MKYSKELMKNVERISTYYEEHDAFMILRRIIFFMIECINYYVPKQHYIIPEEYIHNYITEALKI